MCSLSSSRTSQSLRVDRKLRELVEKHDGEAISYREIGEYIGLSHARVRQIELEALKKLGGKKELWKIWLEMEGCLQENKLLSLPESQLRQLRDGARRDGCPLLRSADLSDIIPVMLTD